MNARNNPGSDPELPDIPTFEVEPEERIEVDPALAELIRRAAAARQMDPNDFLAILIECDARGTVPLWRK